MLIFKTSCAEERLNVRDKERLRKRFLNVRMAEFNDSSECELFNPVDKYSLKELSSAAAAAIIVLL